MHLPFRETANVLCRIIIIKTIKADLLNCFFQSVFPTNNGTFIIHLFQMLIHTSHFKLQHRFLRERSTVSHLLQVYHREVINGLAEGKEIDVYFLDFPKAFDKLKSPTQG